MLWKIAIFFTLRLKWQELLRNCSTILFWQ